MDRPPLPPFTAETAAQKVRGAEDAWNSRDPARVALAYTEDSIWRNRAEFISGRGEIVDFLKRKWARELDYRLIKEVWTWNENRIAVRFAYVKTFKDPDYLCMCSSAKALYSYSITNVRLRGNRRHCYLVQR